MLETVMKHGIIFYVIGVLAVAGVLAKFISYITSKRLVRAAGNIQKSNQKLMRLIKAKFEHACMVSDKVKNVEAFVQKYLYEYKVMGVRLEGFRVFPVKMVGLIVIFGLFGIIAGYQTGEMEQAFQYGAFAAVCTSVLICIHILGDEKSKLDAARNYMVEYLENVCAHRYEKVGQTLQPMEKEEDAVEKILEEASAAEETSVTEETLEEEDIEMQIAAAEEKEPSIDQRLEQEMRFRAILEEFLA